MRSRVLCLAGVLSVGLGTSVANGQTQAGAAGRTDAPTADALAGTPTNYGTGSLSYASVGSWQFEVVDSAQTFDQSCCTPYTRFHTAGEPYFVAPLDLPNGSQVEEIQLVACDTSATNEVSLYFFTAPNLGGLMETNPTTTGGAATPGCVTLTTAVTPPIIIDNAAAFYGLEAIMSGTTNATGIVGARVGYRLRISPAPATATFSDVPVGHPFHRFVEALAAAGITGGCGGGAFCPNAALTRGEMSVFLSAALGLHFPN